ncbi:MAG: hypothetical protein V1792_05860 [Pseudomonadota bacterium]
MFLDKLWLRIRGELLTLKEDFTAGDDIRDRAANLLDRLEHRISGEDIGGSGKGGVVESRGARYGTEEAEVSDPMSLDDLKREWDDLNKQRGGSPDDSGPPRPNPRQLG